MASLLASAFASSAQAARSLLAPFPVPPSPPALSAAPISSGEASKSLELDARIEAARDVILDYHRTHRPPNTARNYAPKQQEWKAWCKAQGFPSRGKYLPGDFVDKGKLLLFIKEEVAGRPPRTGPRLADERKRRAGAKARGASKRRRGPGGEAIEAESALIVEGEDDDECSKLVLMYNTVRGYVSAINKLWAHQVEKGLHSAPQPQRMAMKALKTLIARGEHDRRRREFADCGVSTIRNGYLASQIPDVNRQVWSGGLGRGVEEQALRTQLDFLLGNSMLLRQSNRLPIKLPDLFLMPLPKEGTRGDRWAVMAIMDHRKTNQHRRLEYGAALRYHDHRSCLAGALAAYLFWRWHLSGEPFPCFRTSQDWYRIKVLKRSNAQVEEKLSDSTASSWTRRLYAVSNIRGSKVSHLPWVVGTQIAEGNNVPEGQIRQGSRWNNNQMTGCYLTDLPRQFMHGMANFKPDYTLSYFIARETVKPPPFLCQQVWPLLDCWRDAHQGMPGTTEVMEPNLAAGGFLKLLDKLRDIFLQDSVFLRRDHPQHPIFADGLFATANYKAFAIEVLAAADTLRHEDTYLVAIEKAILSVNKRLRSMTAVMQTGQAANATGFDTVTARLIKLTERMDNFLAGSFSLTFTPGRSRMLPQGYDSAGRPRQRTPPSPFKLPQPVIDLGGPHPLQATAMELRHEAGEAFVPSYKLSRQVGTVPDLWREWTVGLGGLPSVTALNGLYGSRWRSPSERQYYLMRKVLIDEIVARAGGVEDAAALEAAVEAMERERLLGSASLDKFIKLIKEERKRRL